MLCIADKRGCRCGNPLTDHRADQLYHDGDEEHNGDHRSQRQRYFAGLR